MPLANWGSKMVQGRGILSGQIRNLQEGRSFVEQVEAFPVPVEVVLEARGVKPPRGQKVFHIVLILWRF